MTEDLQLILIRSSLYHPCKLKRVSSAFLRDPVSPVNAEVNSATVYSDTDKFLIVFTHQQHGSAPYTSGAGRLFRAAM